MPTLDIPIAASADDAWSDSGSGFAILDGNGMFLGTGNLSSSPGRTGGFRFNLAGVVSGDTIVTAYLLVKSVWYGGGTDPSFEFVGDAADNAPAWDGGSHLRDQITPTTATVSTSGSFTASTGTYQRLGSATLELAPILQEIVDRPGFGGHVRIVATGVGPNSFNAVEYRAYDGYPSDAPKLYVEYTAGGGGGGIAIPTVMYNRRRRVR